MKELPISKSPIKQWVEPIHFPNVSPVSHYKGPKTALMIENYTSRIEETKRKIASLSDKLLPLMVKDFASDMSSQSGTNIAKEKAVIINDVALIYSALGVYDISGVKWKYKSALLGTTWLSSSTQLGGGPWSVWFTSTAKGNDWMDYFGDQSIRETGGTIVVMLSTEGVEYLNSISNELSSSYTNVTV